MYILTCYVDTEPDTGGFPHLRNPQHLDRRGLLEGSSVLAGTEIIVASTCIPTSRLLLRFLQLLSKKFHASTDPTTKALPPHQELRKGCLGSRRTGPSTSEHEI